MSARVSIPLLAMGLALSGPAFASDVGYLYGRVETRDGNAYVGELRWGDEESFWDDIFNASKVENENLDYVSRRDRERIRWRHLGGLTETEEAFAHASRTAPGLRGRIAPGVESVPRTARS